LAIIAVLWTLATAIAPTIMLVALGRALARTPGAVRDGWSSPAGHALVRAVVVVAVAYAITLGLNGVRMALGTIVKVRLTYHMQQRLMRAVSGPTGIEHLEDPAVLDRLALAQGTLMTFFPADAPMFLADVFSARATGFLACLLVGTFRWWVGALLIVLNLVVNPRLQRIQRDQIALFGGNGGIMRRAFYFNFLATRPDAAKEIRVFGLGDWIVERLTTHWNEGMGPAWANLARLRNAAVRLFSLMALIYVAILGYLAHEAVGGHVSLARAAVVVGALGPTILLGSMTGADVPLAWAASALPHFNELEGDIDDAARPGERILLDLPHEDVTFTGVRFAYPGATSPVFDGLDLALPAGRSTAIVGPNGAGKTTFVKLLAGLHQPSAGRITVDGRDLTDLDQAAWQRQVAVVFQDFNRYPLTARENVTLGAPEHADDLEGVRAVAASAGVLDAIEALPLGWDTVLAADLGGVDLSGGQWQRLALARALFAARHGARILVLDEPTAWLDVRGEAAFYERFLDITQGLTSIVISHRFSTVRLADHIVVVEHGRVVEDGTHDELVAAGGTYARMFALQSEHFTDEVQS
jgi:ATP-binding cassette subfamily B protein